MSDVEQALKDMSEKYRAGLTQLQAQVERTKRSDSKQYAAAKGQLEMFKREQWLIDKAREMAGGNQAAIADIETLIRNRATPAHTRMLAALLLATIDSPKSLEVLVGRIVDKADTDALRFFCAMQISNCQNPSAVPLILKAINDQSTDEEFDEDAKLRAKMVNAGVPVNLRRAMILGLLDSSTGANALAAKVKAPMSFQNGWLFSILSLWGKTDDDSWVVAAADVLKNRAMPDTMRVNAATALFVMRKDSKGRKPFPKAAWDALHTAWASSSGKLHGVVGEALKLQGA